MGRFEFEKTNLGRYEIDKINILMRNEIISSRLELERDGMGREHFSKLVISSHPAK